MQVVHSAGITQADGGLEFGAQLDVAACAHGSSNEANCQRTWTVSKDENRNKTMRNVA
jgi:hypothetical protein